MSSSHYHLAHYDDNKVDEMMSEGPILFRVKFVNLSQDSFKVFYIENISRALVGTLFFIVMPHSNVKTLTTIKSEEA